MPLFFRTPGPAKRSRHVRLRPPKRTNSFPHQRELEPSDVPTSFVFFFRRARKVVAFLAKSQQDFPAVFVLVRPFLRSAVCASPLLFPLRPFFSERVTFALGTFPSRPRRGRHF